MATQKNLYFKTHKSFLKKNKKIIIDENFIRKIGFKEAIKLFKEAKIIFLIDKAEVVDKEILIKQVQFHDYLII